MTDFERINKPRVGRIESLLEMIAVSARSNRAHETDIARLLQPVLGKMMDMVDGAFEVVAPEILQPRLESAQTRDDGLTRLSAEIELSAGQKAAMMLASQASMRELIVSLIARLEAHRDAL